MAFIMSSFLGGAAKRASEIMQEERENTQKIVDASMKYWTETGINAMKERKNKRKTLSMQFETLGRQGFSVDQMDIIELNEAFAAQSLACTRALGLADDDERINPNGGAIALGHPLGMSGARILQTASIELAKRNKKYALVTMCIGVGQGYATILERV